ncbi:MAG TPA: hypothetical protein VFQ61_24490 [Polyangiaceae bacterium]|nr:hypothetical protein [Polyangiaceae bacterium]
MTAIAPPRVFVAFSQGASSAEVPVDARSTAYRVEFVRARRGQLPFSPPEPGTEWQRLEASSPLGSAQGLCGVTQHVLYTSAAEREILTRTSAKESGPWAVLIPIRKSAAWWALAQDQRLALFHARRADGSDQVGTGHPRSGTDGGTESGTERGHYSVGARYAHRIYRRLYHARYLTDGAWDFLTYFEFPDGERATFEALLADLRDERLNPEWAYVEAEVEFWLRREN